MIAVVAPEKAAAAAEALDLRYIEARLVRKRIMPPARAAAAVREYRRFLALAAAHPRAGVVPAADVDEAWHAHILNTRRYADDCMAVAGRFMHHEPAREILEGGA
jgi:hypothetical protein